MYCATLVRPSWRVLLFCLLLWCACAAPGTNNNPWVTTGTRGSGRSISPLKRSLTHRYSPTDVITRFGNWTLDTYRQFGQTMLRIPKSVQRRHRIPSNLMNGLRILYVINCYDFRQFRWMLRMLTNIVEMCEFGWEVHVVIQTAEVYNSSIRATLQETLFCPRTQQAVNLTVQWFEPSEGKWLSTKHRVVMQQGLNAYDVFIYSEDDMDIRLHHVLFYIWELAFMPLNWVPGFLRWNWFEGTMTACEFEAELLRVVAISIGGRPYWLPGNPHQAFFILTRDQLRWAAERCHFFDPQVAPNEERIRVIMSSWQLFYRGRITNFSRCMLRKVVPIHSLPYFLKFTVHHMSNKHGAHQATMSHIFNEAHRCVTTAPVGWLDSAETAAARTSLVAKRRICRGSKPHEQKPS